MKTILIDPSQIITLNDYPVHSDEVLIKYYKQAKAGGELPLVPVIRKETVKMGLIESLREELAAFEVEHPNAEYFMLDGSHRTTALMLANRKINIIIYEQDSDIAEAKQLVESGTILQNGTLDHDLKGNCKILIKHFVEKPYFMTVEQKTNRMVQEEVLPPEATER